MLLVFFILGILFAEFILPLLKKIADVLITFFEYKEGQISELINAINIRMKQAVKSLDDESPKYQIGFAPSLQKEEDDEDDDL